jgi:plasmid stabilization system protein ParE
MRGAASIVALVPNCGIASAAPAHSPGGCSPSRFAPTQAQCNSERWTDGRRLSYCGAPSLGEIGTLKEKGAAAERYNVYMQTQSLATPTRRPRFRRASEPPAFRITDDDVAIVRRLARHRFLRSPHIAALVGRSLDRTNDRLLRFFHAGYLDRPRAQLDRFPSGSPHIVYALADRGARLLIECDGIDLANQPLGAANLASRPKGWQGPMIRQRHSSARKIKNRSVAPLRPVGFY